MRPGTTGSPPENSAAPEARQRPEAESPKTTRAFSYPSSDSVKGAVLADLLSGASITHRDVWEQHGSSRAAHHVLRLRQAGWPIRTVDIDVPTSDGRTARIARYELPPETIAEAGAAGQRFAAEVAAVEATRRAA